MPEAGMALHATYLLYYDGDVAKMVFSVTRADRQTAISPVAKVRASTSTHCFMLQPPLAEGEGRY